MLFFLFFHCRDVFLWNGHFIHRSFHFRSRRFRAGFSLGTAASPFVSTGHVIEGHFRQIFGFMGSHAENPGKGKQQKQHCMDSQGSPPDHEIFSSVPHSLRSYFLSAAKANRLIPAPFRASISCIRVP